MLGKKRWLLDRFVKETEEAKGAATTTSHETSSNEILGHLKCLLCSKTFHSKKKLLKHRFKKHIELNACGECNTVIFGKRSWEEHKKRHVKDRLLREDKYDFCDFCERHFTLTNAKDNHVKTKHCAFCHEFFKTVNEIIIHSFKTHDCKYMCQQCEPQILFEKLDEALEHEKNIHECGYCHKKFSKIGRKNRHIWKCHADLNIQRKAAAATTTTTTTTAAQSSGPPQDDLERKAAAPTTTAAQSSVPPPPAQDHPNWKTVTLDDGFNYIINVSEPHPENQSKLKPSSQMLTPCSAIQQKNLLR